ncbi:MAG: hypothetical protein JW874_00975 [Spirochaetales bacterium]|nr:hypothetical protein [Spirochaetales bacterium]
MPFLQEILLAGWLADVVFRREVAGKLFSLDFDWLVSISEFKNKIAYFPLLKFPAMIF